MEVSKEWSNQTGFDPRLQMRDSNKVVGRVARIKR
jgi:hypothetical protein